MAKARTFQGVEGFNRALRKVPRESRRQLTDAASEIAQDVSDQARGTAAGVSRTYAKWIAPTIRPKRGRSPAITMGGARRTIRKGVPIGLVTYGVEFGGQGRKTTMQFLPHRGRQGYALWPTIRDQEQQSRDAYTDALIRAFQRA